MTFARDNCNIWYSGTSGKHSGVDEGVPYNTPIYWTGNIDGQVISIDNQQNNFRSGPHNIVILAGGFYFIFGHTSDSPPPVQVGQTVSPGALIGYSGNPAGYYGAGNDHLHFEVRPRDPNNRDIVVNPLSFYPDEIQDQWINNSIYDYYNPGDTATSLGYYRLTTNSCP